MTSTIGLPKSENAEHADSGRRLVGTDQIHQARAGARQGQTERGVALRRSYWATWKAVEVTDLVSGHSVAESGGADADERLHRPVATNRRPNRGASRPNLEVRR